MLTPGAESLDRGGIQRWSENKLLSVRIQRAPTSTTFSLVINIPLRDDEKNTAVKKRPRRYACSTRPDGKAPELHEKIAIDETISLLVWSTNLSVTCNKKTVCVCLVYRTTLRISGMITPDRAQL